MDIKIPGYDIESLLGKGGMASVFKARQQSFNREVALKVYSPVSDNAETNEGFGKRFIQESQIIAKLHHSHIVQVYDVGRHDQHFYISMEYLHGANLAKKLAVGLTLGESVTIIKQAASALDFAHRKRIIHRDIKPENLMFREDGALVITDFGIAKEMESQSNLTQTGLVIGTPKYMSPEQIRGDDVDHRTDIYALGIVFFRCLTNYLPFDGKDIVVTSYLQHNEPVPKLPDAVACFQPIINRMLEKTPEKRYQKASDIAAALERLGPKAYDPKMTNLDVASESRHAPPTVTRAISGSFTTEAVYPPTVDVSPKKPVQPLPRRKITDFDETLELTEARVPPHAEEQNWPDPLMTQDRQSRGGAWLMSIAIVATMGIVSSQLWGDQISQYWQKTVVKWVDQWQAPTPQIAQQKQPTETDAEAEDPLQPLTPDGLSAYVEADIPTPSSADSQQKNPDAQATELSLTAEAPANVSEQNNDSVTTMEEDTDALDNSDTTTAQATAEEQTPTEQEDAADDESEAYSAQIIADLLSQAQVDMEQWRLTKPKASNAYDKYQQVLELQPENEEAQAGIEKIAQAYLRLTDKAIGDQDFNAAERYLTSAEAISSNSKEIKGYRGRLNLAIEAHEEAKLLDEALRQAELIDRLLDDAAKDEEAGRIRTPAGNNALEKYQRVLALDPDNTVAIDKLVDFGR